MIDVRAPAWRLTFVHTSRSRDTRHLRVEVGRDLLELAGFEEIEHAYGVIDSRILLRIVRVDGRDTQDRDERKAASQSNGIHRRSQRLNIMSRAPAFSATDS
jgi:hypothetical protein